MFPLGLLAAIGALSGFAGYQYSKAKHKNKQANVAQSNATSQEDKTVSQKQNIYNYYTNPTDEGVTLFNGQSKKKRNIFDSEAGALLK